ncbi:MAG: hypothetical protein QOJ62_3059, partial [Actinomycetota bacterium]|nr:hypothetical protein [Actinomycetota bacterium]
MSGKHGRRRIGRSGGGSTLDVVEAPPVHHGAASAEPAPTLEPPPAGVPSLPATTAAPATVLDTRTLAERAAPATLNPADLPASLPPIRSSPLPILGPQPAPVAAAPPAPAPVAAAPPAPAPVPVLPPPVAVTVPVPVLPPPVAVAPPVAVPLPRPAPVAPAAPVLPPAPVVVATPAPVLPPAPVVVATPAPVLPPAPVIVPVVAADAVAPVIEADEPPSDPAAAPSAPHSGDPILPGMRRGSRQAAREEKVGRQRRRVIGGVAGLVVVVLAGWFAFAGTGGSSHKHAAAAPVGRTQSTLLIQLTGSLGAAVDSALVAHDTAQHNGVVVLVPSQVIAQVPGFGAMPFGQALTVGDPAASRETLADLVGVTVDGSWALSPQAMSALVTAV